jgi:hypothetical protein
VDAHRLLRDMQTVLKQIAGSRIQIVVPNAGTALNLDVDADRAERILINVAAYGRERMPSGGRLTIDLDSVVLDHAFVAQYPHVRPGAHVLFTVTEERGALPAAGLVGADGETPRPGPAASGVDLGVLQSLVSDCGGHLWITAEPSGRMVLKIHLPRRALDQSEPAAKPAPPKPPDEAPAKPARSRWVDRLSGPRPGGIFTR